VTIFALMCVDSDSKGRAVTGLTAMDGKKDMKRNVQQDLYWS
jgi:hypothetical protein